MTILKYLMDNFGPLSIETKEGWMPVTEGYCKGFDLDLKFGKMGEKFTEEIFEGNSKVEVKTERDIWKTTGNIFVEFTYREAFSGLVTTEADWWATILTLNGTVEGIVILPTKIMKARVKQLIKDKQAEYPVKGGDDNASTGALVPIKELLNYDSENKTI